MESISPYSVRERLKKAISLLEGMETYLPEETPSERRKGVLVAVLDKGGTVSREEWHGIGRARAYDLRGLGGFFKGKRRSMSKAGPNKYILTDAGRRQVEQTET